MDKTELVLHLVWFIFVSQYTIITTWYSMVWSMGWDYFADLICLNFNESVKLKQRTIAKLRKFSLFSFFQFLPQYDFGSPRVPHMLPVVGKGVTQVLQILFHKLTSRFWRTARIWICGVWSNFSEYIYSQNFYFYIYFVLMRILHRSSTALALVRVQKGCIWSFLTENGTTILSMSQFTWRF